MPISALPRETALLLQSCHNIVTPVDIVKELLDNAIDAGSTSIEVQVSPNLYDKILVRDNGHGISQDDFGALGRRSHTSKLRAFDELHYIGGRSLGFRGEALASINDLATVTITTKTHQDPVATTLRLNQSVGGIAEKESTSAPIGTTVQVLGLFSRLPVRRRVNTQASLKHINQLRSMLFSYAMARPYLKLSFKTLGNDKKPWLFTPKPKASVKEVVLQLYGADLASQCIQVTISSNQLSSNEQELGPKPDFGEGLTLLAFLLRPHAAVSKGAGKGMFISVDSRPVSNSRGTIQKLATTYKQNLCRHYNLSLAQLTKPFMQLDIICTAGSYDPNISPTKDEVLFANEKEVLELFEELCRDLYPNQEGSEGVCQKSSTPEKQDVHPLSKTSEAKGLEGCGENMYLISSDDWSTESTTPDIKGLVYTKTQPLPQQTAGPDQVNANLSPESPKTRQLERTKQGATGYNGPIRATWKVDLARTRTSSSEKGEQLNVILHSTKQCNTTLGAGDLVVRNPLNHEVGSPRNKSPFHSRQ
jgi:DNA mismatch repair protein MutL